MNCKLNGLLRHYALVLMLLEVQWRPVFPNVIPLCLKNLTDVLIYDVGKLLPEYEQCHGAMNISVPDDVPNSIISGTNVSENLQDIYTKNYLFYIHISKVKEYQINNKCNKSVVEWLSQVRGDLRNHLAKITAILIDNNSLPTTPAPPQISHSDDYARKVYGWGVIVSLKDWLTRVSQVLAKIDSDKQTARK